MRRSSKRVRAATVGLLLAVGAVTGTVLADAGTGESSGLPHPSRARRIDSDAPNIDTASRNVVVVGDSVLFTRMQAGHRENLIVPLADLAVGYHQPGTSVLNRSYPGLSTLHPMDGQAKTLRPYMLELLETSVPEPDVVVIAVSSIDITLFPDDPVTSLAPPLIEELHAVEQLLVAEGVDAVFVPVFGINGDMYNSLRSLFEPFRDYRLNERINRYNDFLRESDLPLLFDRFAGLDGDGDGQADRRYFVDNDPLGQWPDDGIHPNALGERVFGDNLANGLVTAFERT